VDLSIETKVVNRRNRWTIVTRLFFLEHDNGGRQRRG